MKSSTGEQLQALRQLCNDANDKSVSDEEFFLRLKTFLIPEENKRQPKIKPKKIKARRGLGSY